MDTITCRTCHLDVVIDSSSITSRHRTSEGTIAYIRCPLGHLSVVALPEWRPSVPAGHHADPEPCCA